MKKVFGFLTAIMLLTSMTACSEWLEEPEVEVEISRLDRDAEFVATNVICKRFEGVYASYPKGVNYFFELTNEAVDGLQQVMILDLVAPEGSTSFDGEYIVGYEGKYIALSRFDVFDPNTGLQYMGGTYYATAKNGFITDYYGFLTEGKVLIYTIEGVTHIVVDGKSLDRTVKVKYEGEVEVTLPK